ncbi:unnamed protein product, partial [Brassica oleracea]
MDRLEENGQQMEHTIVVKQDVVGLILKNQLLECFDSSFLGSIVQLMFILSIYGLEHPASPIALLIFFD